MKPAFKKLTRTMLWILGVLAVVIAVLGAAGYILYKTQMPHHTVLRTPAAITPSGDRQLDAIRRGVEFLKASQESDGEFSAGMLDPKPAYTALVVEALARCPDSYDDKTPFMARAVRAITARQQPDGGIYIPRFGIGNYSTSVSVMALASLNDPKYEPVIKRARDYIMGIQQADGGLGYGADSRPDLSNTSMSLEALRKSGLTEDSDAFKRAAAFISRCQNSSETNKETWAANDGGFIYRPGNSRAGTRTVAGGKIEYISYGLMSYAGLVSFLWANVDREDERVRSALRWVRENWTLDENRNIGDQGLYYYYLTMAKALQAYGVRVIETVDGNKHDWPVELSEKIMSLQKPDGSWSNTNPRWYEKDPVLVTAYVVRTLSICYEEMHPNPSREGSEQKAASPPETKS